MKKKIVALCLVVCLLAIAIVGGTMAYFTDTEVQTNVFTLGEIQIDLTEDFDDTATLLPAVGDAHLNQIKKIVNVENEGKNEAFVRVHIALPALNTGANVTGSVIKYCTIGSGWVETNSYTTAIGKPGKEIPYNVSVLTYTTALEDGETASKAIDAVYLESAVTQDDIAAWNATYGEGEWAKVYVYAEGVQAGGFGTDYANALNTAFGTPGFYDVTWTTATNVANEAQLLTALGNAGANVTLTKDVEITANLKLASGAVIDGNGKTVNKENAAYNSNDGTINAGIQPTGGTIKNITVTGESFNNGTKEYGFRAVYASGSLTSNLYIEGATLEGTYAINVNGASTGSLIVEDSVLKGWVSYDKMPGARFTDCTFAGTGTSADNFNLATVRPYADTVMNDCGFAQNYNFSAGVEGLVIELNDCYVFNAAGTKVADLDAQNFTNYITVEANDALRGCSVIVDGVKVVF